VTGALTLLRALLHRAGTTVVILVVALCATAAATVGPTYYVAARQSILQDTLRSTNVVGRGFEAIQQGSVRNNLPLLQSTLTTELDGALGGGAVSRRIFVPEVDALEATAFFPALGENLPLVWRTEVCAHLRLRAGHCPAANGDVAISTSLAAVNHWHLGQRLKPAGRTRGRLTVVAVYVPPDPSGDYWFGRGVVYFPAEIPTSVQAAPYDALFTPRSTIDALPVNAQGTSLIARPLAISRVTPADVDPLSRLDSRLNNSPALAQAAVTTGLLSTTETVHSSWSALAVPVVVVTAELLVLTWLLLFLVVTDAVEARGTEIALAKLRGYSAARSLVFGLGEPVALLAIALPVGAIVGWGLTGLLSHVLLRPGTAVALPGLGWAAASIASVGSLRSSLPRAARSPDRWSISGDAPAGRLLIAAGSSTPSC
jgi:putative ABC transport system permease protein